MSQAGASVSVLDERRRAQSVRAFAHRNRGRRALLVVGYDGSEGHVVSDLPLSGVTAEGDEVRIRMGDPRSGHARNHAVWGVDEIRMVRMGRRDLALRFEYPGGRTVLLLPRATPS